MGVTREFKRGFKVMRSLPADIPLASHPAMFNMAEKFCKLGKQETNPFIDPQGYTAEMDFEEGVFTGELARQQKASQ